MKLILRSLIGCLLLLGCGKDPKEPPSHFLQQQEVALVPPRLAATATIIDSTVTLTANLRMPGVQIHYTTNGTSPTQHSPRYQTPLVIREAGEYTFKAFHEAWKPSEEVKMHFYAKGLVPAKLVYATQPSPQYPGVSVRALINHQKASLNFSDKQWVGFDTTAIAQVHFTPATRIGHMQLGYLSDPGSWIFPPQGVEISMTLRTGKIKKFKLDIPPLTRATAAKQATLKIPIAQEVSSMQVKVTNVKKIPSWHEGKGAKGWLFMDEWIFYE